MKITLDPKDFEMMAKENKILKHVFKKVAQAQVPGCLYSRMHHRHTRTCITDRDEEEI